MMSNFVYYYPIQLVIYIRSDYPSNYNAVQRLSFKEGFALLDYQSNENKEKKQGLLAGIIN